MIANKGGVSAYWSWLLLGCSICAIAGLLSHAEFGSIGLALAILGGFACGRASAEAAKDKAA
jgi:hypothetical protein